MPLPPLRDDRLLLLVFGPGVGELIAVHVPGGHWLVVDGCRKQGAAYYAQRVLDHYAARAAIIVLTHPHRDHAAGVAEVVERATSGPPSEWPVLAMLPPPDLRAGSAPPFAPSELERGVAEGAIAAIAERWDRYPTCRWDLPVGDFRTLGSARLTVLSPEPKRRDLGSVANHNHDSTALLIEWEKVRVVLGADLEPGAAWASVVTRASSALAHAGLKVPHHASRAALHDPLLASATTAVRIATPFATQGLPRFDDAGGVAHLHRTGAALHLTGLPRAYAKQGGTGGHQIARATLAADAREFRLDPPVTAFPDCFVAVEWDATGAPTLTYGPGSVVVTPSAPRGPAATPKRRPRRP
jgi:Metallo-beta-lactamase superfamily